MNKLKAIAASAITGVVLLVGSGAASAATEPPAYGVCVSESTGGMRVLEKTDLARSIYGSCKSTETKVSLSSKVTLPAAQKSLRDQWAADKAAKLPETPTATDRAYKSWLEADPNQVPSRVVYVVDGKSYLCSLGRYRTVTAARHRYNVPTYSCALLSAPTPTPTPTSTPPAFGRHR